MGADIHLFAEVEEHRGTFQAVSDGQFLMPRNYDLFAALAGVRADEGFTPKFPPRGIPANVSQHVSDRYFMPVISDEQAATWGIGEYATTEYARELVERQLSSWLLLGTTTPLCPSTGGYISNPDWHSPSWLTTPEVAEALAHARYPIAQLALEFRLLLEYLQKYAAETDRTARIVFWFDN